MRWLLIGGLVAALVWPASSGAISTTATPIYHGKLELQPSRGTINPDNGEATLTVRRWRLALTDDSDGIFPDLEPVVVDIGDDSFRLEAGMLKKSRSGKRFTYRSSAPASPIRFVKVRLLPEGAYLVSFSVRGLQLYRLVLRSPRCLPTAFIVGDDDGFSGLDLSNPIRAPRRVTGSPIACAADAWPWV